MRKPIIAGNWKMNKTPEEAKALVAELLPLAQNAPCQVVVCPPFLCLGTVAALTAGSNIALGAQNCHVEKSGAYTGEISAPMLKSLGVEYVILGHSERRAYFGETNEFINAKVKAVLAEGMTPILCVGETLDEREAGVTETLVRFQTAAGLSGLNAEDAARVVVAYEPVWAIGTGKTATSADANAVCGMIRDQVALVFGKVTADAIRIQYGGSMNPGNAKELMGQEHIDGGLIGGASLKADDFSKVIHFNA